MKKNNNSSNSFKMTSGLFIGAVVAFLVACGNKGGGNNVVQQAPVMPFQQCFNCQNINGSVFFSAESIDYTNSVHLYWTFSGQSNYAYQTTAMTPGTYYGPVATTGQMSISQSMNLGYCVVPAGTYTLATVQAGQWGYGIASGLALQAINGSYSMIMSFNGQVSSPGSLQNGQLSSSTNTVGRMFGNLQIQSINGQQCQQVIGIQ